MMKLWFGLVLWLSVAASVSAPNPYARMAPSSPCGQVVQHDFYSLSYCEWAEQAEWVAYYLPPVDESLFHEKRPRFVSDPLVSTQSADSDNYKKSGYDRGHLCPAADMKWNHAAYQDTFFTSNISPQKHSFNDGVWKRLEEKTRYWAQKFGGLYVVTGGILRKGLPAIGPEQVAIPEAFYKVLYYEKKGEPHLVAFIVPHAASDAPLYRFTSSVDQVEKLTGIDFCAALPDVVEQRLEAQSDYKGWAFE